MFNNSVVESLHFSSMEIRDYSLFVIKNYLSVHKHEQNKGLAND